MLSFINSVQRRSVFMSAIITLGSGAVLGEALAGDHCPDTPFDFEDTWVADECDVCSISGEVLTCTLSTAHADNQMTVIEGYAASNAYSVFGVDDEDLFCCTYDNDDVDEAYDSITDIDVVGASSADLLAFR